MTYRDSIGRPYMAALTRYDTRRDPVDHQIDKILPEDIGVVHAYASFSTLRMRPGIDPHFEDPPYREAVCGATVKVILTADFDPGDPDACSSCSTELHRQQQQ